MTYNMQQLSRLDDNTFVVASVIGEVLIWGQSHIYAIDSLGAIKWDFKGPILTETAVTCIQHLENGRWLYATSDINVSINPPYSPSWNKLVCRDSSWNLVWEKRISPTNWWRNQTFDMKPSPDGNFVVAARWAPGPGPEEPQWIGGCLYKISPEGEEIWRFCDSVYWPEPPGYAEPFAGGLVVLPSGSVVFIGRTEWYAPQPARSYGWMYKVDANGCRYEPCSVGLFTPNSTAFKLEIFPNPAQDQLSIRLPYLSEEALVQVLDPMGRTVLQMPVPSAQENVQLWLGEYPAGLYAIRLMQKGRLLGVGKVLLMR